jgi:two-component system nitrogen regulation response regulator NtrX
MAARYIHAHSNRSDGPFVTVACAAIAPDQMEVVLFGRESPERGIEQGLLEQANGGVLLLDEVADMPLGTQSKILRVLVDQAFTRVGGASKVHVDLRVISSTTKHLPNEISEGRFREELYHRLNVVPIEVPSLEARSEDIPILAEYFIEMFHREQGLALRKIADDAMATLQTMRWPGNVRQLRNLIERVLILGEGTGPISLDDLPMSDEGKSGTSEASLSPGLTMLPLREARELFERQYLMAQINRFGGNISRTAGFVGMERSALHRKLKSLGVVTSGKTQAGEEVE